MGAEDGQAAKQRYLKARQLCLEGLLRDAHKELKQVPTGLKGRERTDYNMARDALKVLVDRGF